MNDGRKRIEWKESRGEELFLVIAEKCASQWEFAERSTWAVSWYPMASSPDLVVKAENQLLGA